jgi:hypothetical protein
MKSNKYIDRINKKKEEKKQAINVQNLTDAQKEHMSVKHYTLHLPATLHPQQLQAIEAMARSIINNEPFVNIHFDALKKLIKYTMLYRNVLFEVDEGKRWSLTDEGFFIELLEDYGPLAEAIKKESRIDVRRLDEM